MAKLLSAALILLSVGGVIARGQKLMGEPLSDGDKSKIIESVLDLELRTQASVSDFANIRKVSSDNIEFVELSYIAKLGFTLVAGSHLRESKKDRVVEYLLFKTISLRDGVALVVLSRVTEGQPCFGAAFSHERNYTYESRRTAGGWVSQLTQRPPPMVSFALKYSAVTR